MQAGRLVRVGALGLVLVVLLGGCGSLKKSTNSLPGQNSGWNIYLTSGTTHFRSLVLGDHLVMITPGGTRALH